MKPILTIIHYITAKPLLSVTVMESGFLASVLAWCHVITVFAGLIGGLCGAIVGVVHLWELFGPSIKNFFKRKS